LFEKGEGTRTEMLETQAKYDLAEAQVIEARDNLQIMQRTLSGIVGMEVSELDPLASGFRVLPMQPVRYADWEALALANNAEITAHLARLPTGAPARTSHR
jgi:protease secretion system outer membrane protein